MTWFGSSFSNLKDQITTLTKEVLAEADEERERPKFIPVEKFDRLVKICEEKEEQLCDLQQEVDALKKRFGLPTTCSADGDPDDAPILQGKNRYEKIEENRNDGARDGNDSNLDVTLSSSSRLGNEESVANEEKENTPHAEADYCPSLVECSKENLPNLTRSSLQDVFREIENLDADNLEKVYKRVGRICEEKKRACAKTSPSGSHRNGSDETMSNDSEKSDDSLLNDFEVLKSRGSSSKSSTDDFASMSNAPEVEAHQPSTQMTRSTSTQSEFEFSPMDSATQTESELIMDEIDHELTDEQFWRELPECSESVKNSVVQLVNEYRRLKLLHRTSNQESQTNVREEQDTFPEERLKLKNSTITKHVNDLTAYSRKLENFCSSLSEVSDELVDQDVELSSLYKELELLRQTKDRLQEENAELAELVERYRAAELASQDNIDSQESDSILLDQRNKFLEWENELLKKNLASATATQQDSEQKIRALSGELEQTLQTTLRSEEWYKQQINLTYKKVEALEVEVRNYVENTRYERDTMQRELSDRDAQIATTRATLETVEENHRGARRENDHLKSELAEIRSRSTVEEKNAPDFRAEVVELGEQNETLRRDIESKNERLQSTAKKLLAALPSDVADVDIVFESLASMVSAVDESLHLGLGETQPWREMVSRLPTWCECVSQLKQSQEAAGEHIRKLETRITELESRLTDANKLSSTLVELEVKLNTLSSERDQVIASLKEKHSETLFYHSELQKVHSLYAAEVEKNKEYVRLIEDSKQKLAENGNVASELERLREHLMSVEQTYTNELVNAEKRIQELQYKLSEYEERFQSMSAVQTSVSVRANQMSESLQKEVKTLTQDKEQLSVALKKCRAELQSHIHEVQNLRSALDLFHRNKDSEVFEATEKLRSQIDKLSEEKRALNETVRSLQTSLEMEKKLSSEKQQLADDLRSKTQTIEEMDKQLLHLRNTLKKAEEEMNVLHTNANSDNQFKSDLLKNIFVRYVTSNTDSMRTQTLQILSEVLNFSPEEKRSLGLPGANLSDEAKGLTTAQDLSGHSLIDEFIQFMEKESDPRERRKKETSSGSPNILFSNSSTLPDVMLPTLSQHSMGHNSMHILKDVLQ